MQKRHILVIAILIALIIATIPLYSLVQVKSPVNLVNNTTEGNLLVTGNVNQTLNLTLNEVMILPSTSVTATVASTSKPQDDGTFNFTGINLWYLLQQAGIPSNATSVTVLASDKYYIILQISEIKNNANMILAYEKNGELLASGFGPLWLIISSDPNSERWVYEVAVLDVS